jgi:DNA-binding response OmpR family regulator
MPRERILVIEDEPEIGAVLEYNLAREGYRVAVLGDGEEGLERVIGDAPDLVLLDLMLPGLDGLEVCRRLKEDPTTRAIPIIMVTAKGEESDVILGLGMGADDYVLKPFSPKELVARVRAVLRRGRLKLDEGEAGPVVRGPLVIDDVRHRVTLQQQEIHLTATEFRLLHVLARHPGRTFTRDQLLSRVIGGAAIVTDRNIDAHIRTIRKRLGEHRHLIETVHGVGYRFRETPE